MGGDGHFNGRCGGVGSVASARDPRHEELYNEAGYDVAKLGAARLDWAQRGKARKVFMVEQDVTRQGDTRLVQATLRAARLGMAGPGHDKARSKI